MADNGHCSTCQAINSAASCSSAQTFCAALNKQTVTANESYIKINSLLPSVSAGGLIYPSVINAYKNILLYIYQYGVAGTRNPNGTSINNLSTFSAGQSALLSSYNALLTILSKSNIAAGSQLTKAQIDTLNRYIKNFTLNANRCNVCNTGCNTTCQASAQYTRYGRYSRYSRTYDPCYSNPYD